MSSTNRGALRNPADAYYTPQWCVDAMLPFIDMDMVSSFLEPCRGGDAIYSVVDAPTKLWCEIDRGIDYLTTEIDSVDLSWTNPPFTSALEFLHKSLNEAATVIYLLPVNFMGSQERKPFWQKFPPTHLFNLSKRPCFAWQCKSKHCQKLKPKPLYPVGTVGPCPICNEEKIRPATDSINYGWFCWDGAGMIKTAQPFVWI